MHLKFILQAASTISDFSLIFNNYFKYSISTLSILQYFAFLATLQLQMHNRIQKSFLIHLDDNLLREGTVEKKSKWLKAWRKRKMILFSNRLIFAADGQTKPRDSNVIYLGNVTQIGDCGPFSNFMKIVTNDRQFEVKFQTLTLKESWIEDIRQAHRTYKINRSENLSKKCRSENICPNKLFCTSFECF